MSGWGKGWRDFDPTTRQATKERTVEQLSGRLDRGRLRGAKQCIVDELFNIYDYQVAKAGNVKGIFFRSRKEAKRYVGLSVSLRAGMIRSSSLYNRAGGKWWQVKFPLHTRRPDGLKVQVTSYIADFVYEAIGGSVERDGKRENVWVLVVEDVKPSGGHREDLYLLKKAWFEAEYGLTINEF